jgi:hypothetical protein
MAQATAQRRHCGGITPELRDRVLFVIVAHPWSRATADKSLEMATSNHECSFFPEETPVSVDDIPIRRRRSHRDYKTTFFERSPR